MSEASVGADPPNVNLDGADWFGDGSAFESGEDLAAALLAFSGAHASEAGPEHLEFESMTAAPSVLSQIAKPRPATVPEFQLAELPAATAASVRRPAPGPGWGARPAAQPSTWGIRNSVKILKTTEDVIRRLREDAVEVAWRAAAAAADVNDR